MSTDYTGNKKAAQAPSPAPGPGVLPGIIVPADNDPNNVATMFVQQYKTMADYWAWLQNVAEFNPPYTNGNSGGFTTVAHVGSGTGTVVPSGNVKINTGTNVVLQILSNGATGTATFQTSINGGTTYGGTQTTSASMTDATSGITLAFTGTFVSSDTYQFLSAFTPLEAFTQADGYVRSLTDHNGYRMGRVTEVIQNWQGVNNGITSGLPSLPHGVNNFIDGYGWLSHIVGTNTSLGLWQGDPIAPPGNDFGFMGLATQQAFLSSSFSSGDHNILASTNAILSPSANTMLVAEWEMCLNMPSGLADSKLIWQIGLTNNTSNTALSSDSELLFEQITTDTTWFFRTANGSGGNNRFNTGVAIDPLSSQRFRMEYYGANAANGTAVAKVFINEALVLQTTTTLPQVSGATVHSLFWCQRGHYVTGTCPYQILFVGPLRICYNRFLSNPAL